MQVMQSTGHDVNDAMLSCLGFAFLNVTSAFGMGCYR